MSTLLKYRTSAWLVRLGHRGHVLTAKDSGLQHVTRRKAGLGSLPHEFKWNEKLQIHS